MLFVIRCTGNIVKGVYSHCCKRRRARLTKVRSRLYSNLWRWEETTICVLPMTMRCVHAVLDKVDEEGDQVKHRRHRFALLRAGSGRVFNARGSWKGKLPLWFCWQEKEKPGNSGNEPAWEGRAPASLLTRLRQVDVNRLGLHGIKGEGGRDTAHAFFIPPLCSLCALEQVLEWCQGTLTHSGGLNVITPVIYK